MKAKELYTKIVNDKKGCNHFFNLMERWMCEREYEDINDYLKSFQSCYPETIKATKRPFGFQFQCDDGILHMVAKNKGNGMYALAFTKTAK